MKKMLTTAILILAVVLTGCQANLLSADQIAAKMKAANEKINSYESKMEMTVKMGGQTQTTIIKQWMKRPDLMRVEAESSEDGKILSVSDGKRLWTYMEKKNQVMVFDVPGEIKKQQEEMGFLTEMVDRFLKEFEIEVVGQEKVAGRDCYILNLTPKQDAEFPLGKIKLWVDRESWMPLKQEIKNDQMQVTMTYKEIRYNVDLDDNLFKFEAPPGVKVKEVNLEPKKLTLEEARKTADFQVFEPTYLPEGVTLQDIRQFEFDQTSLMLNYRAPGEQNLTIMESKPRKDEMAQPWAEKIMIGSYEGQVITRNNFTILSWVQDGTQIVITGTYDKETMVKIAESMK
ncbi:outer membrane lipoprotein-sorting protein [Calderihabitans maritimus]|nr:outer membrane lipoprotein-sorting protein [Calderihabitans maritimus]